MKKLLTWPRLIRHAVVLLAVIVLINLGLWQLRRLDERRAYNASVIAGLAQPPTELTGQPVDPDAFSYHRVTATGEFDNKESIVIINRPYQGRPGMRLIVPLKIDGSEQAVLVDQGWIPLAEAGPEIRRGYAVDGLVTVEGIAFKSQPRPDRPLIPADTLDEGETRIDEWFRVDIDKIEQQLPYDLLPIYIQQSPAPDESPETLPIKEETFDLTEGSHLGYAMQWFGFATILAIVYIAFMWQEVRRKK